MAYNEHIYHTYKNQTAGSALSHLRLSVPWISTKPPYRPFAVLLQCWTNIPASKPGIIMQKLYRLCPPPTKPCNTNCNSVLCPADRLCLWIWIWLGRFSLLVLKQTQPWNLSGQWCDRCQEDFNMKLKTSMRSPQLHTIPAECANIPC